MMLKSRLRNVCAAFTQRLRSVYIMCLHNNDYKYYIIDGFGLLTETASKQLYSQSHVCAIPSLRVNTDVTCFDGFEESVVNDHIPIFPATTENLHKNQNEIRHYKLLHNASFYTAVIMLWKIYA